MSLYYFDSSALAKRYVAEIGHQWVRHITNPHSHHVIFTSAITMIEITSLMARRHRNYQISLTNFMNLRSEFRTHAAYEYQLIEVDNSISVTAQNLTIQHPIRTLDAIQLACALRAYQVIQVTPIFVFADDRLRNAASAEGLTVENPENYP